MAGHDPFSPGTAWDRPARVFLVCGHRMERQALREMLAGEGLEVAGATGSAAEALSAVPVLLPQLALVDTALRDASWIRVCRRIWDASPSVPCLTLGSLGTREELRGSILAGARGHAVRMVRGGELVRRIRAVAAGEDLFSAGDREAVLSELRLSQPSPALTSTERRILLDCARGCSDTEMTRRMGLARPAFEAALQRALAKLGYPATAPRDGAWSAALPA